MATTPRAGIINLNFKDVSEMAKNIADNDPWKTGIEAAGKVLTDRERYIMYQRALADAQGKERPEDKTIGDLVSGAGKKIGEGASWLKDKWDRLDIRSPFEETLTEGTKTESPITETASEKGSREMIGYKPNQSPIETDKYRTNLKAPERANVEPNDEVSFGFNQDVGQGEEKASPIIPFATGEQTPEQIGVKVDYGTSEPKTDYTKLRSPFAMREKAEAVAPEKAQESGSPFEATEVTETKIKAPRMTEMEAWSEMNRLDPQRAKFDYDRVQNQKKSDIETMKALGKDANLDDIRAMHNAYMNNLTALYNQGANDGDPRVIEAKAAIDYTAGLLAEKGLLPKSGESSTQKKTPEELEVEKKIGKETKDRAYKILDTAIDETDPYGAKGKDGIIDNELSILRQLNDLLSESGINPKSKEWQSVQTEWEAIKSRAKNVMARIGEVKAGSEAKKERERSAALQVKSQSESGGAVDRRAAKSKLDALNARPTSEPDKADAVLWIMRKNSGAMIGPNEILQYMQGRLPSDKYNELVADLSPTGMKAILGVFTDKLKDAQIAQMTAKYMQYINVDAVKTDLNVWANVKPNKGSNAGAGKGKNKYGL